MSPGVAAQQVIGIIRSPPPGGLGDGEMFVRHNPLLPRR
jgi:hypothetical protein